MTKGRLDGLYALVIGCGIFLLLGVELEIAGHAPLADFRGLYFSGRCLLQHCDPYNEGEVLRIAQAEGGIRPSDSSQDRQVVTQTVYLPTAFFFTVPFAMLPWGPSHLLWMALTAGSFILASFLIWSLGAKDAPILSGILIGFLVANSDVFLITGNAAGIVISFCAVAVWCFLRERFVLVGIFCLAVGLALKPQDAGLVWLYFLLAGGVYRRRALQTVLATVALGLPEVLWVGHVAPQWISELHSNLQAYSSRGGISDPRLAFPGLSGAIDLQTVINVFCNDPRIYNLLTYFICGPLLLIWIFITLRSRPSPQRAWLALASIAALSMLPVYHRQYDAKLLLLTVPACALLWAENGLTARLALLVNTAGIVMTGDFPTAILSATIHGPHLPTAEPELIWTHAMIFRTPLVLLVVGIFYLWVYASRSSAPPESAESGCPAETPVAP